jgi:hypothetical protein
MPDSVYPPSQEGIPAKQKKLAAEHAELSFQQFTAMKNARFTGMTEQEAKDFDQRRSRISELSTIIAKLKASDLLR